MVRAAPGRRSRALVIALGFVALAATACVTNIRDELGPLTSVTALSDNGTMAGSSIEPGDVGVNLRRFDPDGGRVLLEDPHGWKPFIDDVNDAGEVLGHVDAPSGTPDFLVSWDRAGKLTDLRDVIPNAASAATFPVELTASGRVIGYRSSVDTSTTPPTTVKGIWVVDLRTRQVVSDVRLPAEDAPLMRAANDAGVVVGIKLGGENGRWMPEGGSYRYEPLPWFRAFDINDAGDIAGLAWQGERDVPAVWPAGAPTPILLPPVALPAGSYVSEGRINDAGLVALTWTVPGEGSRPVRWRRADPTTWAAPETFPAEWSDARLWDLNAKGEAIVWANGADGARQQLRWDLR